MRTKKLVVYNLKKYRFLDQIIFCVKRNMILDATKHMYMASIIYNFFKKYFLDAQQNN